MSQLSSNASRLLGALPLARAANPGPLMQKLGLSVSEFAGAVDELERLEMVTRQGKRICKDHGSELSPEAAELLKELPPDGTTVGNLRLRSLLPFDDETYMRAKRELVEAQLATKGVGHGGTLARTSPELVAGPEASTTDARLVKREDELYEPFVEWLQRIAFDSDDPQQPFAHAVKTATPKGHKRGSGKWSRPDVTAVSVTRFPWLPTATVDVSVYEIKRSVDALKLESVYEAAAQQRWAHFANLVVEMDPGAVSVDPEKVLGEVILGQIRRFGLGLYTMTRRGSDDFDTKEALPAIRQKPDDEQVNEFLQSFFDRHKNLSEVYRQAIK